jgi:ribosomal protein L29
MKMITSIVFELNMPDKEVEAYKTLSDKEREACIEEMKDELVELITKECTGETNFTKFTVEIKEGE